MELKVIEDYYDNGQLKDRFYEDSDGVWQGLWESYYEDGTIESFGYWKDDSEFGLWFYNNHLYKGAKYFL